MKFSQIEKDTISFILFIIALLCLYVMKLMKQQWTDEYNVETYYPITGGALNGSIDFPSDNLIIKSTPIEDNQATNKKYVDKKAKSGGTELTNITKDKLDTFKENFNKTFLPLKGGTLEGDLKVSYISIPNPAYPTDVANKDHTDRKHDESINYVDMVLETVTDFDNKFVSLSGDTIRGTIKTDKKIIVPHPTESDHIVTKKYISDASSLTKEQKLNLVDQYTPNIDLSENVPEAIKLYPLTGGPLQGSLTTQNTYITDDPKSNTSVTNKKYVDKSIYNLENTINNNAKNIDEKIQESLGMSEYLMLKGGTVTGNISVPTATVSLPQNDIDVANKKYVDTMISPYLKDYSSQTIKQIDINAYQTDSNKYLPLSGGIVTGSITAPTVLIISDPSKDENLTNKKYVDAKIQENDIYSSKEIKTLDDQIKKGLINDKQNLPLSGGTMTGMITAPSVVVQTPVPKTPTDIVNKLYFESELENSLLNYYPLLGGPLKGPLTIPLDNNLTLSSPVSDLQVANKSYVDDKKSDTQLSLLQLTGGTMKGKIVSKQMYLNDPTLDSHLANLQYLNTNKPKVSFIVVENTSPTNFSSQMIGTRIWLPTFVFNKVINEYNPSSSDFQRIDTQSSGFYISLKTPGVYRVFFKGSFGLDTKIHCDIGGRLVFLKQFKASIEDSFETISTSKYPFLNDPLNIDKDIAFMPPPTMTDGTISVPSDVNQSYRKGIMSIYKIG